MLYVNSMCIYGRSALNAPCLCCNKAVLYVDSRLIECVLSPKSTFWLCSRDTSLQLKLLFIGISNSGVVSAAACFVKVTLYWFEGRFFTFIFIVLACKGRTNSVWLKSKLWIAGGDEGCVLARIWQFDTYHDTGVTMQFIVIYCDHKNMHARRYHHQKYTILE